MKYKSFKEFLEESVDRNHETRTKEVVGGKGLVTQFNAEGITYQVQIERTSKLIEDTVDEFIGKKIGEVSFFATDSDPETAEGFSTTGLAAHNLGGSMKIYGTVAHTMADYFKDYDAIYCTIEKIHSNNDDEWQKKIIIYKNLVRIMRNKRSLGNTFNYTKKEPGREIILISKFALSPESQTKLGFISPMKEMAMLAGFDVTNMW